jgi:competence protein ComGC
MKKLRADQKGYSLLEAIIALLVIALVLVTLLSGLVFVNSIHQKAQVNQKVAYNERALNLYFQKQVLKSERIVSKLGRVYLQDLESPDYYYNFYRCQNGLLRRYKVDKTNFYLIGSGENSQFSDSIQSFSLSLGVHNEIVLAYTLVVDGQTYQRKTTIWHGKTVEFLD